MATILYVDDEPAVGLILEDTLERAGHRAIGARDVAQAVELLAREPVDLVVSDYVMPGASGLELLELLRREGPDVPLIMLTGHGSIEHAVEAIKAGAADYITKPVRPEQLGLAVDQALELARLRRENSVLRGEVERLEAERSTLLGESAAMRALKGTIAAAAPTRVTVLVTGESGTGKERVARRVHAESDRRGGPFVSLNCAALPAGLVESALFGHERGAFTGALKRTAGAFERAHGGTLLLDEIGEMPLELQPKLLRVLQEQEFERVGGTAPLRVDVRVVATTNRQLAEAVAQGRFREDLYYRLRVLPIDVPPLRERRDDIPLLATHFARRACEEFQLPAMRVTSAALARLHAHDWPGNVRELEHAVQRAVVRASAAGTTELAPTLFDDLSPVLDARAAAAAPATDAAADEIHLLRLDSLEIAEAERRLIARALEVSRNNRTRAAELLGISVRTLRNKLNGSQRSGVGSD